MTSAQIFQLQSFLVFSLLTLGVIFRKKRTLHVRLMGGALIWDILLILQIELTRSAVGKASDALKNPMILNIHVALALASVLLYGFMLYSGLKLLKNENNIRPRHRTLGYITYIVRLLTLITSFWAVAPKETITTFIQ
ncbi:MAG: hypothetical protein L6Q33_05000 [Bacteriovoracaceae bacterium]|jgi:uncharacterized membrane protein YozB (DUF420 family)|nr:hypothetical protein [Bacteriovoracaceae bacterium]